MPERPKATCACLFRIDVEGKGKPTFFVMAMNMGETPAVRGFETLRAGIDHFEQAYYRALERGYGWSAGAMLNWMQLQPRIFEFKTMATLTKLLGKKVVPEALNGTGVHEVAFRCRDQEKAAKVYDKATPPRLSPG